MMVGDSGDLGALKEIETAANSKDREFINCVLMIEYYGKHCIDLVCSTFLILFHWNIRNTEDHVIDGKNLI